MRNWHQEWFNFIRRCQKCNSGNCKADFSESQGYSLSCIDCDNQVSGETQQQAITQWNQLAGQPCLLEVSPIPNPAGTEKPFPADNLDEHQERIEPDPITWVEGDGTATLTGSAAGILDAAQRHMRDRAATYDSAGERSIGKTVRAFNTITGDGLMNTEERGWLFMMLLKAVRAQSGNLRMDSYEDGAAYFALAGEAAHRERSKPQDIPEFLKRQAD